MVGPHIFFRDSQLRSHVLISHLPADSQATSEPPRYLYFNLIGNETWLDGAANVDAT